MLKNAGVREALRCFVEKAFQIGVYAEPCTATKYSEEVKQWLKVKACSSKIACNCYAHGKSRDVVYFG